MKALYRTANPIHYVNNKLAQSMFIDLHVTAKGIIYFRIEYVRTAKHWETNVTVARVRVPLADMPNFMLMAHAGGWRIAKEQ